MSKNSTLFVFLFFVLISSQSYSQLSFGIHTGYGTKSAYFGLKTKSQFMPYASLQFANLRIKNNFDGDIDKEKIGIILPTIGTKYYLKDNGKLKPYFDLTVSKPIFYIKPADEFQNISLWAGGVGFGTEYFIDPQFSIGGEFGLNYLHANYNSSYFNGTDTEIENYRFNSNPTYGRISINFYFLKK